MTRMYRSVTAQALHYMVRPHAGPPRGPVRSPAAWNGDELARDEGRWLYRLSAREQDELARGLDAARATQKPLEHLRASDLPLPSMRSTIEGFRRNVAQGLGVQVIRGIPTGRWSREDCERFFWCFGLHLGIPGAQNRDGELLGHVRDLGASYEDPSTRGYKTAASLSYHCDAADAVGLLCLRTTKAGGKSRFASSVTVWNKLHSQSPDLAARLFEPFLLDTRGDGGLDFFAIAPCRFANGELRTFYHADYFRTAQQHPGAAALDPRGLAALDAYDAVAGSEGVYLEMDFEPGDIQLLSNHTVVHARSSYVDHDEPEKKRHLLRLWLSLGDGYGLSDAPSRLGEGLRLAGELLKGRARKKALRLLSPG